MKWWSVLWLLLAGVATAAEPPTAPATAARDSLLTARISYWGPIPARTDSNTAVPENPPTRTWERVVNAPYDLVGIPFRLGNIVVHETVETMDSWGLFDLSLAEETGLLLPGGFLLLPAGGYSGLTGWEAGVNIRHPAFLGEGNKAYLALSTSTRHADKMGGGFRFRLDPAWTLELGGGGADMPLARYFGRGPRARVEDESFLNRVAHWGGLDLIRRLSRASRARLRIFYSRLELRDSFYRTDAALARVHAGDLPAGFPGQSRGVTAQLAWCHDSSLVDGRPTRGTFKRVALSYYRATDGSGLAYQQYTCDLQRFLPLWHTKRVLALRAYGSRIRPTGGPEVPLSRLISTYDPYSLRGLKSHRYYGLGNLGVAAEYRWPIWVAKGRAQAGLDAYLFTDMGQVYDHGGQIALDNLVWTYGGGIRLLGNADNLLATFEVGFSADGVELAVGFGQAFQFAGKGMVYGRDPTHQP